MQTASSEAPLQPLALVSDSNSPRRVLVAEDDPLYRRALEHFLTHKGYAVHLVSDGLQALADATSPNAPRLLVLDWIMPGLPGPEVCRQLRATPHERYQYVLLLTARHTTADIVEGLEAGADDYLTKPFNVHEFLARIRVGERMIKHAEAERVQRKATSLSLFLIDLDHFKRINDEFGHLTGDAILHEIAQRLSAAVRVYDIVGRYGGEEFIVAAAELESERPQQFAERLRLAIASSPVPTSDTSVAVTASIGVATSDSFADRSIEKLIQAADAALYHAKRNGRNRVEAAHQPA